MYNFIQRFSGVASFAMTTLMALVVVISLTTPLIPSAPTQTLTLHSVHTTTGRKMDTYDVDSKNAEYARLTFDLDADLTSMFNWNTKLLYAFITVDYLSTDFSTNTIVIWDRLVRNKKQAKLKLKKHHNKYLLRNFAKTFEGISEANMTLHVNPVPYLGIMYDTPLESIGVVIPRATAPAAKK
ncbi:Signal peptidase complex subunit [Coemansia sp. RSA 2603]|nr:Signal peptidase complex subunit [Coemansia sp. RSA 2603]